MYKLRVFGPSSPFAVEVREAQSATEALALIPALLTAHNECERVELSVGLTRLFFVDREGVPHPS